MLGRAPLGEYGWCAFCGGGAMPGALIPTGEVLMLWALWADPELPGLGSSEAFAWA